MNNEVLIGSDAPIGAAAKLGANAWGGEHEEPVDDRTSNKVGTGAVDYMII